MEATTLPPISLSADEQRLLKLLEAEPPSHARHCFSSAIQHLQRAHLLLELDPAMAVFRGITAEEEAASGLMQVLIARKYPGAEHLKPRDHVHKHAVTPFLRSVLQYFSHIRFSGVNTVKLAFKEVDGNTRLVTAIRLEESPGGPWARPIPPLNLSVREGDGQTAPNFKPDFQKLIEPTGYANILKFLQFEANARNRVLYAGKDGFPVISYLQPEFLLERQKRVFAILKTGLLIWPYEEIQPFVIEALTSFLQLVMKVHAEPGTHKV
jgi:hypothetical protein